MLVLLEHKSWVDGDTPVELAGYIVGILGPVLIRRECRNGSDADTRRKIGSSSDFASGRKPCRIGYENGLSEIAYDSKTVVQVSGRHRLDCIRRLHSNRYPLTSDSFKLADVML